MCQIERRHTYGRPAGSPCLGTPKSVLWRDKPDRRESSRLSDMGFFNLDERFKILRYTFLRQRHVLEVPGIYLIICRTTISQGARGVYVGQATNLRKRYVDHYNERHNEALRLLIETCDQPEFAWLPVYQKGRLTGIEQCYITRYKDFAINIQYL